MAATHRLEGVGSAALVAGLTLFTSFDAGGFFPEAPGAVAAVLLLGLALRVAVVPHPFAGFGRGLAVAAGALAGFAGWILLSGLWSDAWGRALLEFDRALAYLLTLVVFGAVAGSPLRLRRATEGLAAAVVVVCIAALASRLVPDAVHTSANIMPDRLAFPLTYWNALALLAGIGLVICFSISCERDRPAAARIAGAAAIPLLAVTLLLTYSRGGVAAAALMLVLYLAIARPSAAMPVIVSAGPPAGVALVFAYRADLLASADPTTPAAAAQGHGVLAALVACTLAAGAARWLLMRGGDPRLLPGRRVALAAAGLATVAVLAAAVQQLRDFSAAPSQASLADTRSRLTDASSNGRTGYWRTALDAFGDAPVHGTGAGTYQLEWWSHRSTPHDVAHAHSLYLQTLGELGIVGLLLLLATLVAVVRPLVTRRSAAVGACALGWVVHAAFDWDWEVPAVTLWLFALAAIALARPAGSAAPRSPLGLVPRAVIAMLLVAAAAFPAFAAVSQRRLESAIAAYSRGDCDAAIEAADSARRALPPRDEPRQVLGYCAARAGDAGEAVAKLRAAVSRDPQDFEGHYGLAVVQAAAGADPLPAVAEAARLNPLEPAVAELQAALADPSTRKRRAMEARLFVNGLDYPPLGG